MQYATPFLLLREKIAQFCALYSTPFLFSSGRNLGTWTAETITNTSHSGIEDSQNGAAGTTTFSTPNDEGKVVVLDSERRLFEMALKSNVVDAVTQYLAKPRIMQTWVLTPLLPALSFIQGTSWTDTANIPVFADKVFGFSGIKYTTNIKVVVNSTPFQQGRLRLAYYPCTTLTSSEYIMHMVDRTTISQLPGIEMNLYDGSMTLSIPWCSYQEYLDVTGTIVDPLVWRLAVFSPLLNGPNATITSANVTVWVWYTDVQLYGCSTGAIVAQSNMGKNKIKRINVAEQESKPLSSWLGSASKLVGDMSAIPSIGALAGPTSLMLSGMSGLASYFGYARPTNCDKQMIMNPHYLNAHPNSEGTIPASVLALHKDAKVKAVVDFSPGGMDEMSINFVKKQWAFFDEFTWTNSTALGAQLYQRDLNLTYQNTIRTNVITMTPITMLSNLFRHYRGGIEIMFKFVKTGFHTGSIAVSCQYGTSSGPALTLQQTDPLYRTVLDIQEGDEFCINFPYMNPADFLYTFESFGTWYIHVVNPLICPETVAQSVVVQMYVRGADDMEFSTIADANMLYPVWAQGGTVDDTGEITCEVIGGVGSMDTIKPAIAASTVSETCSSLLQVLKYGSEMTFYIPSGTGTYWRVECIPSAVMAYYVPTTGASTKPYVTSGFMPIIKSCYAFQRGGHTIDYINMCDFWGATPTTSRGTSYLAAMSNYGTPLPIIADNNTGRTNIYTGTGVINGSRHLAANALEHGTSIVLPYKSKYRVVPVRIITGSTTMTPEQNLAGFEAWFIEGDRLTLRVADDYQSMYWVGVPTVTTTAPA